MIKNNNNKLSFFGFSIFQLLILVLAVVTNIFFRIPLLNNFGFYEPDGFYHFAVVRAAVQNGFNVPKYLSISGWPASTLVSEPEGLYWVSLLPYAFLQFFGVSYYTIMRLIPLLFGLLDAAGAYFLAKFITKDKNFGLLAMFFVSISMADAARTTALVYRGDSFVAVFLMGALLLAHKLFETGDKRKKIEYAIGSGIVLALTNFVWNGAAFATAVYILGFVFIVAFSFIFDKKDYYQDSVYLLLALAAWFIIVTIFRFLDIIGGQTFTGKFTIALLAMLGVGWYVGDYLMHKRVDLYSKASIFGKFALVAVIILLGIGFIYVLAPDFIYQIFVGNGFIITSSFAATIQELQPPTAPFLYASYGPTVFSTPMSVLLYLYSTLHAYIYEIWTLMFISLFGYLFFNLNKENTGGNVAPKNKISFWFNPGALMLISYFAVTSYLQIHAVRFNSLLSIPLAIFSAYTIFILRSFVKKYDKFYSVLIVLFVAYVVYTSNIYLHNIRQADNINPQFVQALGWLKNNTPTNSVVLTLWPDGSVVEGVANRTSVTDSVGSQNATKALYFAQWLFSSQPNPNFLLSKINGKPDYILVRNTWMFETSGIFTEAEIPQNMSNLFAYSTFQNIHENVTNNSKKFVFSNPASPYYVDVVVQTTNNSSQQQITAYVTDGSGTISPYSYVGIYNQDNATFSLIKQTAFNQTNNQVFLITYSNKPSEGLPINVTGAYIFNTGIGASNMIKLLYFCNNQQCLWDNNVAKLQQVYWNADTKIFRVIYNASALNGYTS